MKRSRLFGRQLILIFCLGWLCFNYPLLSIFSKEVSVAGIPILYAFLFVVWIMLIGLMAFVMERRGRGS